MANVKISDLAELAATPDNADLLEIVDMAPTPTSKKITAGNLRAGLLANIVEDPTPELGGNLDLNEKGIAYDWTLAADHTYSGDVITATAGETVVIGDVCYLKADGKFWKMNATAEVTTKGMCAMATGTITADASGVFLLKGLIRDDTWAWTAGSELWVPLTPGNPTETRPSATGNIVRLIGYAKSADYVWFDPDKTYIEI